METKHTKGDWRSVATSNDQGLIIDDSTGDTIAVSYYKDDAPLIAAAPELLEALNMMMEAQSRRRHPLGAPDEGIATLCAEAANKARAAIAKAIG